MVKSNQKERMILTVLLTFFEATAAYILYKFNIKNVEEYRWWIDFLSYATPVGALYFLNYYLISPFLMRFIVIIWSWTGHYEYISKEFSHTATQCIAWLSNTKVHWGVVDSADICQNANTCEGLLAIKKAGLEQRYKTIYKEALHDVLKNVTDRGLPSKSLACETVVCTSMILYLYALERRTSKKSASLNKKFDHVAKVLWETRCRKGWGVYVEKTDEENCSIANTFWALYALSLYRISKSQEYRNMVLAIYENSNNSLFGYVSGDTPRLWPTAMSIVLYYNLEKEIQIDLKEVYNVKKALKFVFKSFCYKGIECESEILHGLESKSHGIKKAPWTHITIAFVTEAFVAAYKNQDLGLLQMDYFIKCIKKICQHRLIYRNGDSQQCYYIPQNIEIHPSGIYTFPTAYIAWALGIIKF